VYPGPPVTGLYRSVKTAEDDHSTCGDESGSHSDLLRAVSPGHAASTNWSATMDEKDAKLKSLMNAIKPSYPSSRRLARHDLELILRVRCSRED
jgi:hypothetical protein